MRVLVSFAPLVIMVRAQGFGNPYANFDPWSLDVAAVALYQPHSYGPPFSNRSDVNLEQIDSMLACAGDEACTDDDWSLAVEALESAAVFGNSTEMVGGEMFDLFAKYYNSANFGEDFVLSALKGTGDFDGATDELRRTSALLGAVLFGASVQLDHELSAAISAATENGGDRAVTLWDAAYTGLYAGSLEGAQGSASGRLLSAFAKARCESYPTACTPEGEAFANMRVLHAFRRGQPCAEDNRVLCLRDARDRIVVAMATPLAQGLLGHVRAVLDGAADALSSAGRAYGFVVARALLPHLSLCSSEAESIVASNFDLTGGTVTGLNDEADANAVRAAIEGCYGSLGLSCTAVGGLIGAAALPALPLATTQATGDDTERAVWGVCRDANTTIGGHTMITNVETESKLDVDMKDIKKTIDCPWGCPRAGILTAQQWLDSRGIYVEGLNSNRTGSAKRTLYGSPSAIMRGEAVFDIFEAYFSESFFDGDNAPDYGQRIMEQAFAGIGAFAKKPDIARQECVLKGNILLHIWMTIIHNVEVAIEVIRSDAPYALELWDEAWALYSGSLEGSDGSGLGFSMQDFSEKRCSNFATCTEGDRGIPLSMAHTIDAFERGQRCIVESADALCLEYALQVIVATMTIPVIQGTLRYAYKADPKSAGGGGMKEWTEGYVMSMPLLPQLHECDPEAAQRVRDNFDLTGRRAVQDGYKIVVNAIEACYERLGVSCDELGAFGETEPNAGDGKWLRCEPPTITIAGYAFRTDVTSEMKIDEDVVEIGLQIDCRKGCPGAEIIPGHWGKAYDIFTKGWWSQHTVHSKRTLQRLNSGFMRGKVPLYDVYSFYFGSSNYGSDLVLDAITGEGVFQGTPDVVRYEGALRGVVLLNVWMWVVQLLEAAISNAAWDHDGALARWDEAWALYAGGLEGINGEGAGRMLYAFADEQCAHFATCVNLPSTTLDDESEEDAPVESTARVNIEALGEWTAGQACAAERPLSNATCLREHAHDILGEMNVALVQALLRYSYALDPAVSPEDSAPFVAGGDKGRAEAFIVAKALLPQLNDCDENVANLVARNFDLVKERDAGVNTKDTMKAMVPDGHLSVKLALESCYEHLRVPCWSVGALGDSAYSSGDGRWERCFGGYLDPEDVTIAPSAPSSSPTMSSSPTQNPTPFIISCDTGWYRVPTENTRCLPCPNGTYTDKMGTVGREDCKLCPTLRTDVIGAQSCPPCHPGAGVLLDSANSETLLGGAATNATVGGTYNDSAYNGSTAVSWEGSQCFGCPVDTFSDEGLLCSPCPVGRGTNDESNATECNEVAIVARTTNEDDGTMTIVGVVVTVVVLIMAAIAAYFLKVQRGKAKVMAAKLEAQKAAMVRAQSMVKKLTFQLDEKQQAFVAKQMEDDQFEPLQGYRCAREHVVFEKCIGSGAFGEVWTANMRGEIVAVKRLLTGKIGADGTTTATIGGGTTTAGGTAGGVTREFLNEALIMAVLQEANNGVSHDNLVQMKSCCWDGDILIVLEFCALGSITDVLKKCHKAHRKMEEEEEGADPKHRASNWLPNMHWGQDGGMLRMLSIQTARGCEFLSTRNPPMMHRDIKPQNILIQGSKKDASCHNWVAKVADFGCSRALEENAQSMTQVGDVFSFGMLLVELLTGIEYDGLKGCWADESGNVAVALLMNKRPDIPEEVVSKYPEVMAIIKACWSGSPKDRPTFTQVVEDLTKIGA